MGNFRFGGASLANLHGVHPDLIAVARLALAKSHVDFSVVEGVRTEERQEDLVADGASMTMDSRHLTGHAIDAYPWVEGQTSHSASDYAELARAFFEAAQEMGIHVDWGGEWTSFVDRPHWELNREEYA